MASKRKRKFHKKRYNDSKRNLIAGFKLYLEWKRKEDFKKEVQEENQSDLRPVKEGEHGYTLPCYMA